MEWEAGTNRKGSSRGVTRRHEKDEIDGLLSDRKFN
jgi:hypothetical protein